jgi:hypothetical protein
MRPRELLTALNKTGVDYVLIGGLAATLQGTTRVTSDMDVAYATDGRNVERLCDVINQFEPQRMLLGRPHGAITLTPDLLKREPRLQLSTTIGEIDLLRDVDGFRSYSAIKTLSEPFEVPEGGGTARILSIEGLLKAKRAMRRPKDEQDIVELEALKQAQVIEAASQGPGK